MPTDEQKAERIAEWLGWERIGDDYFAKVGERTNRRMVGLDWFQWWLDPRFLWPVRKKLMDAGWSFTRDPTTRLYEGHRWNCPEDEQTVVMHSTPEAAVFAAAWIECGGESDAG